MKSVVKKYKPVQHKIYNSSSPISFNGAVLMEKFNKEKRVESIKLRFT